MREKNANIELLRMVSMLLIVMHHAVLYSDILSNLGITLNKYFAAIIYIGGKYGANIFFAITAYFLIDKPFRFKRVVSVWKTTLFYSLLFFVLNFVIGFRSYELRDICEAVLPICYKSYWFVTAYVGLILLSPFLNVLIHKLDKTAYIILLIIVGGMVSIPVTFLPGAHPFMDESHLFLCVFIYLAVGFYKRGFVNIPSKIGGGYCCYRIPINGSKCCFDNNTEQGIIKWLYHFLDVWRNTSDVDAFTWLMRFCVQ